VPGELEAGEALEEFLLVVPLMEGYAADLVEGGHAAVHELGAIIQVFDAVVVFVLYAEAAELGFLVIDVGDLGALAVEDDLREGVHREAVVDELRGEEVGVDAVAREPGFDDGGVVALHAGAVFQLRVSEVGEAVAEHHLRDAVDGLAGHGHLLHEVADVGGEGVVAAPGRPLKAGGLIVGDEAGGHARAGVALRLGVGAAGLKLEGAAARGGEHGLVLAVDRDDTLLRAAGSTAWCLPLTEMISMRVFFSSLMVPRVVS